MASFTYTVVNGQPALKYIETDNQEENEVAADIAQRFNAAPPGTYKDLLATIQKKYGEDVIKKYVPSEALNTITDFYKAKNVSTKWDTSKGAKPPVGDFDPGYYSKQVPEVLQKWNEAGSAVKFGGQTLPDIDITERYDPDTYLQYHYTTVGKHSGMRANAAQELAATKQYQERWVPTDREQQIMRDTLLAKGPGETSLVERQAQKYVDEQGELRFNALVSDTLKETLNELNKAKWKETQMDFMSRMPEFSEIYNLTSNLSNSILGDTGIGGYLNIMGGSKAEEKVTEGLKNALGMGSNVQYNWQEWFDNTLTKKYETLEKIEDPLDAKKQYELDKEFATRYINDYLKPRFDTSRSMSEFISYLDVTDSEQNILQTQTVSNKLKELGTLKAQTFVRDLAKTGNIRYFDPEFYFDPTGNDQKSALYQEQKDSVAKDWDNAKKNPGAIVSNGMSWEQLAYQYGVDLNNKDQFAQLHYQLIGKDKQYDAAADTLTNKDLIDFLEKDLAPTLAEAEKNYGSNVFLEFVTPEQLADSLLGGLDPAKTPEAWKETLKKYGIEDTGQPVEDVKNMLMQTIRTVPAESIRTAIEELNKQNKTPTQELLGIEYIQRPEDVKTVESEGETALYNVFKNAGFAGTEDEFYTNFMPDVNRSEMALLSQGQKGVDTEDSIWTSLKSKDPFEVMGAAESLFDTTSTQPKTTTTSSSTSKTSSYLTMLEDDDETANAKSKSGQQILNEFTSMFGGFKF
jgi:hypothetical protein